MKNILPILIGGIVVISGLGAGAFLEQESKNQIVDTVHLSVNDPVFIADDDFISVEIPDASRLITTGKPLLPVITKTILLPFGSIIEKTAVDITYGSYQLDALITPSPPPIALTTREVVFRSDNADLFDEGVYGSSEIYPADPFSVSYGVGIDGHRQVTYVNIRCNARYQPAEAFLQIPKTIDIEITYTPPEAALIAEKSYDLLIITPEKFQDQMIRLKNHKESIGIACKVALLDTIYDQYDGVADWEEVKMFIKDEIVNEGIRYVLLAGGRKGQTDDWWAPEFRSHNFDGAESGTGVKYDETYTCDLYFADTLKYSEFGIPELATWDTNGNGIYAEGPLVNESLDKPDYYPDVYFGRLPLRYSWEAKDVVDKIIAYETGPSDPSWFKKAVLVGGDTTPPARYDQAEPGVYEGELVCDTTATYLDELDFESYKMYTSTNGDYQLNNGESGDDPDAVAMEMNQGCGWVNMQSHANPAVLGNFLPDGMNEDAFVYFYTIMDMNLFQVPQEGRYPFMVCDGCHNAQFDVTVQQAINAGSLEYPRAHFLEFIPTDAGSWMVLKQQGGGIGLIGNTALGYGYVNTGITHGLGGWIMPRFAHAFAVQGRQRTGEIWAQGITDYINNFPIHKDEVDRKTLEERGLLGDPSICLGAGTGKVSSSADDEVIVAEKQPVSLTSVPTWNVGDQWVYKVDAIDFTMQELEDRGIDLYLSTGQLTVEVSDVRLDSYVLDIGSDDIDLELELVFNPYTEDNEMVSIPAMVFEDVVLDGELILTKDTLAFDHAELTFTLDIIENLDSIADLLAVEFPAIIDSLKPLMNIDGTLEVIIDVSQPWPIIQFPFDDESEWGIPAGELTVSIDGSVESIWLRLLHFVNKFFDLIPPSLNQYLPTIDLSELLEDLEVPTTVDLSVNQMDEFLRKAPFTVAGQEMVNLESGSFSATHIKVFGGVGNLFYCEQEQCFVLIDSPMHDFLPAMTNLNLELVE